MKTYTFTLPKTTDNAKKYKNSLIERVITAYPWLTIDSSFDFPKSNLAYLKTWILKTVEA